ncbi:hypothetical protein L1987_14745 [Smallanthus sonchifolius]|uniref:Uncharacterized protein n=1 Tax=Smallanthus sonchifolius TaxID=185202 RepID=A0ACB9J4P4_9ASTR|nr:hypothetical protein L1987_14745 [Smallanthus sonchifolius]
MGASARGKIAQTYIQGKDLIILYKKGKISKSRLGTSNRRIRKKEEWRKREMEFFTKIYTVNDSAPREQREITAKASTNAAAYETHPWESYTVCRVPLSL